MAEIISARDSMAIDAAVHALKAGELIAFPTDTVYGLGAIATNESAVRKLFSAKNRAPSKALPLLLADGVMLGWVAYVTPIANQLIQVFWPGALTIVMRKLDTYHSIALAKEQTVAVRVPAHDVARSIVRGVGEPITGTSANRTGARSPVSAAEAAFQLGEMVSIVIDDGPSRGREESTVIDITQPDGARILRQGVISREEIQRVLGSRLADD